MSSQFDVAWLRSGLLSLTGHRSLEPLWPVADVLRGVSDVGGRISHASGALGTQVTIDAGAILSARAAMLGLHRNGRISPGGSCRLLESQDGWIAINLARAVDYEHLRAAIGMADEFSPWDELQVATASVTSIELADRAQLLGIAAAPLPRCPVQWSSGDPEIVDQLGSRAFGMSRPPLVVDLSALWAGPLCAHLLGKSGAHVLKVESAKRPDGARMSNPTFFQWLHHRHELVTLDFESPQGHDRLRRLVHQADVVIEGSRPRALLALGIDAHEEVASRRGKVWISLTGYGRRGHSGMRVAFGDDAGVAAGLVALDAEGEPVFCGDAIADPISGLQAARAVLESQLRGGGELLDLSMVDAVRSVMTPHSDVASRPPLRRDATASGDRWIAAVDGADEVVVRPAWDPTQEVPLSHHSVGTTHSLRETSPS